ncbi:tetratricopeptide repeat protein [Paenibacillus periandrae]|uniref:tetratricopeptide repeat protein n=1 Tax=Paenibacillus periandrae TaxID=1761741 RepID=UPI001F09F7AD|nr:NB-ARC domain-containing protein [Paenibacillus periandrae]
MNDASKKSHVKRLIEGLENLNGTIFESFCHAFLETIVGYKLVYRGATVSGAPTGYTVDTYNADISIIAEYSSEKNYFSNNFAKPLSDVEHAFKKSNNLKCLYLFSNRTATNTESQDVRNAVNNKLKKMNQKNFEYHIYDARLIAEKLVDMLKFLDYSSELVTHLPVLENIINEHCMTNLLPTIKSTYLKRFEEIEAISILESENVLFLYGISGIGKTDLSISIAHQLKEKYIFDVIVWVDGRKITSVESLNCLEIERVQSKQNILGLIKRKRVLLIIDGLDTNVDAIVPTLLKENKHDSKIIITSQKKCMSDSLKGQIHIEFLNDDLAKRILNYNIEEECPLSIFNKIKQSIGCHPLLLDIINKGIQFDGITWRDIEAETLLLPNYEDTNGQSFFKRLLQSHFQTIQNELVVINWLEGQSFNKKLLQHLISKSGINKLLTRSFLSDYRSHNYKMHDLVYNCITLENTTQTGSQDVKKKFIDFFVTDSFIKNFQYFNALHTHRNIISKLIAESPDDFDLVPTYLTLDGLKLSDFESMLNRIDIDTLLSKELIELVDQFKVITYIECVENIHRLIKRKSRAEAQRYAFDKIPTLEKLLKSACTNIFKFEVMHHLGKFYTYIKEYDRAIECFSNVIQNTNDSFHSKLQLAKFSKGIDIEVCRSYLREIFLAFENDASIVSISIVLAAFNELKKYVFADLAEQFLLKGTLLETAIMHSSVWGYSQPFQVMTEVGKTIAYEQPKRYIEIIKLLPEESREFKNKEELFYLGQVYKELGKCYQSNSEESISSLNLSRSYFEGISTDDCYYCTMIGECYILLKLFDRAIEILHQVEQRKRNHFWYQRYSQYYQGVNDFEKALDYIEEAIEGITHQDDEKYRSAFLRQKAQILTSLDTKEEALRTYEEAIECCDRDKFRIEIENEMKVLLNLSR